MCDPLTIGIALTAAATLVTAGGQVYGGMVEQQQAKFDAKIAGLNVQRERAATEDAWKRRNVDQMRQWRLVSQRLGEQRAGAAAGGLDVNFGSIGEAYDDILMIGMEDSSILNENYIKEVEGYDINAANYTLQGQAAKARGKAAMTGAIIGATGTLLSGASQVAGMYYTANQDAMANTSFGPPS